MYFPPTSKVVEVMVPELRFLAIEGEGTPIAAWSSRAQSKHSILILHAEILIKNLDRRRTIRSGPWKGYGGTATRQNSSKAREIGDGKP